MTVAGGSLLRWRCGRWRRGGGTFSDALPAPRVTSGAAGGTPSRRCGGQRQCGDADGPVSPRALLANEGGTVVGVGGVCGVTGDP